MNPVSLSDRAIEDLYVILKPREETLSAPLEELLAWLERALYDRLTIDEMEQLRLRFSASS